MHKANGDMQLSATGETRHSGDRYWTDAGVQGQVLVGSILYVYSTRIFHKWDFMLINQKEKQHEATGICVSDAFSVCANMSHQVCTYVCMYCT